ncbi:MAG TPA: hypothetical protein VEJ36_06340 [Nitrososphaerales archaeon]|nr:hypothetical protein [Nitrososphaerales archaeon]
MSEEQGRPTRPLVIGIVVGIIVVSLVAYRFYGSQGSVEYNCVSPTLYTEMPCVFVSAGFSGGSLSFEVMNQGQFKVTLSQADISWGQPGASEQRLSLSLNSTVLGVDGHATFEAPTLNGLVPGDRVSVLVKTTSDTYYLQNLTA